MHWGGDDLPSRRREKETDSWMDWSSRCPPGMDSLKTPYGFPGESGLDLQALGHDVHDEGLGVLFGNHVVVFILT